jgi:hypothetical protein
MADVAVTVAHQHLGAALDDRLQTEVVVDLAVGQHDRVANSVGELLPRRRVPGVGRDAQRRR